MFEREIPDQSLIAVVDDDQRFRESMRRLLKSLGYAVGVFSSPTDFLASSMLDVTACLIADVQMPSMTGVELYRHLIEKGPRIPTILVTAYRDDAVRARALCTGAVCYLCKPFDDKDLIRCLIAALEPGARQR
jgi:FixJ family two-component response regulator